MTGNVYKALMPFEQKLHSALNAGFTRLSRTELDELSRILQEHRGNPLTNQERTCPHCLLVTLKKTAQEYDAYAASPRGKAFLKELENGEES